MKEISPVMEQAVRGLTKPQLQGMLESMKAELHSFQTPVAPAQPDLAPASPDSSRDEAGASLGGPVLPATEQDREQQQAGEELRKNIVYFRNLISNNNLGRPSLTKLTAIIIEIGKTKGVKELEGALPEDYANQMRGEFADLIETGRVSPSDLMAQELFGMFDEGEAEAIKVIIGQKLDAAGDTPWASSWRTYLAAPATPAASTVQSGEDSLNELLEGISQAGQDYDERKRQLAQEEARIYADAEPAVAPEVPQTREQQLEVRRQKITHNLAVVAANMEELDDFELVDPGEYSINARPQPSVDLYMRLRDQMGRLGSQVSISDGLMLGSADQATSQMLAEINRRREGRGEPSAETVFDQQQAATEITPLTSARKTADMVEFSTSLANAIEDLPRVLTSIDTNNPMWGRVNALRHDNITFGKANESAMAASDDLRKRILTTRRIYQDKRYVGRWEQEIEYNRSRREADEGNSKTLGSYRETLIGEDRKIVEEVRVGFDNRGRVYDVDNVHYAEGVQTGITRLQFDYNSDGHITQTTEIELDQSWNELSRKAIKPVQAHEERKIPPEIVGDPELTRIYTGILQEEGGAEMGEKFLKAVRFMMSNVPGLDFKTAALRLIKREFREPNG